MLAVSWKANRNERIFNITFSLVVMTFFHASRIFWVHTYLKPANFEMTPMCTSSPERFAERFRAASPPRHTGKSTGCD